MIPNTGVITTRNATEATNLSKMNLKPKLDSPGRAVRPLGTMKDA
jgi:hypothetical protein